MKVLRRWRGVHQMTMAMDVAGREFLLFVMKSTYAFPDHPDDTPAFAENQRPLTEADEFTGEPGYSATLWESDYAFRKARCDVIAQGAAYAPQGLAAEIVPVGIRVGNWQKAFNVVGHREWRMLGPKPVATRPVPFRRMPFSYDTAFGGIDRLDPEDPSPPAYLENPAGRGFASPRNEARLPGLALPNTEEPGTPVTSPFEEYRPMAFGPVSRGVPRRLKYAGTYDQKWQDEIFPFLPRDFDERYYQAVGEDQQIDKPTPGTPVVLVNLTPRGREAFRLPDTELPVRIMSADMTDLYHDTVRPDTLILDPEAREFSLVWRVEARIRRGLTDFRVAWVGPPSRGMERALATGRRFITMEDLEKEDLP